jgi:transcriptional regulator with XRE-family HTH domain
VRRSSQLDLALASGVSQRHISFIESGRSRPSREVLAKLASGLEMPLRVSNELLLAAGFAPLYGERPLDLEEMQHVREALERILAHQEPYPALVTDANWDIVMSNQAANRILGNGVDTMPAGRHRSELNFMRLMLGAEGLRSRICNWPQVENMLLGRLRRDAALNPGCPSAALLTEFGWNRSREIALGDESMDPVLVIELLVGDARLRLFSTFTTFATSHDVSLQELRIDMSFPADAATKACLHRLARNSGSGLAF